MVADFKERIGSIAKASAGFSYEGGKATIEYQVQWEDTEQFCKDALGSVAVEGNRLIRVLPLAHPAFPWLFVNSIATIEGYQFVEAADAVEDLEADPIPQYALYQYAKVVLEFAPRPYALFKDESIATVDLDYYDDDGEVVNTEATHEYWRFVEYATKTSMEYLTAQHGQYRMAGTLEATAPSFPGQVRLLKKSKNITLTWHHVPFRVAEGPNILADLAKLIRLLFLATAPAPFYFKDGQQPNQCPILSPK